MNLFPHISTCQAWIHQFTQVGHVDSKKPTRNHCAICEINGCNLAQLVIYCSTNPKAPINEVCAHLFNLQNPRHQLPVFSPSQVLQAELLLGLTCNQKYHMLLGIPTNQFSQMGNVFPYGGTFWIANTLIRNVIDIAEVEIKLEHNNQKHRKTPLILRVNDEGVYNCNKKFIYFGNLWR